MKISRKIISFFLVMLMVLAQLPATGIVANASDNDGMNMYENSDFIETEQPELTEATKELISLYKRNPTIENYLTLREEVKYNYDQVLIRKESKLAELIVETEGKPGSEERVSEMNEIVQEMYTTYWNRINSSMLRFTDPRLLDWDISSASEYEYIPVMGAGESIYVKRTPVTNAEYAEFVEAMGAKAPSNWSEGKYPEGEDDFPVNFVSYKDAKAYCEWLTKKDGDKNTYRLPNESEWELAAGHMPKDAAFNCGVNDGRTSVEEYAATTRGAHGAIDFWGNVWEWTSTVRPSSDDIIMYGVKGGSWKSERTDCRTEHRKEGRDANYGYDDVGFRVIQVLNGEEPEQKVELATLDVLEPGDITVKSTSDTITLSWEPVKEAVEYQIFEYFKGKEVDLDTGSLPLQMIERGQTETTVTMSNLEPGSTHYYIVQPISYKEFADNVSPQYAVEAICMLTTDTSDSTNTSDLTNTSDSTNTPDSTDTSDSANTPDSTDSFVVTKETLEKNSLVLNTGLKVSQKGNTINVKWGKVSGAEGYSIYVQYCGNTSKSINSVHSGNVTSIAVKKVNGKKLNLKKNYKVFVVAYKNVNEKKVTIGKSITAHIVGRKNTKYTNAKAVKVKKASYTLKVGKKATIKARAVLVDKNKKNLSNNHEKKFRYATSNKNIATVSKAGKIKAVGKGSCTIYVYARNGYAKKIKVTVK